ncbi:hypothetical protein J5J10_11925 [Ciceribacter sp. L1K23]|uniref:hypothetical protein n=1 Tax=unclassified Ciceribacter TaxID=2628820 RepID=UPI001ABE0DE5|nr:MULTISPECIES: hypothetical protein [unclassified Ciceribacter]MBO3759259.1 hypothetical protein [Ciceribacter sp. L1K22]MBR0556387.1 hypothetical protein [Ciceribacter sp. L1K23]
MFRLAAVLYILVATALAGASVTTVLSLRMMEPWQIAGAFAAGCVIALPIAWVLARKISATMKSSVA